MKTLSYGELLRINFNLADNSVPIVGATVTCIIKRLSDNAYYNGSTWTTLTDLTMTAYDASNFPGRYTYSLTPASASDTIYVAIKYNDGTNDLYEYQEFEVRPPADVNVASMSTDALSAAAVSDGAVNKITAETASSGETGQIIQDVAAVAEAMMSKAAMKDILLNRSVAARHANGKPQAIAVGAGGAEGTIITTLDVTQTYIETETLEEPS